MRGVVDQRISAKTPASGGMRVAAPKHTLRLITPGLRGLSGVETQPTGMIFCLPVPESKFYADPDGLISYATEAFAQPRAFRPDLNRERHGKTHITAFIAAEH
jgi:hypothetical protein